MSKGRGGKRPPRVAHTKDVSTTTKLTILDEGDEDRGHRTRRLRSNRSGRRRKFIKFLKHIKGLENFVNVRFKSSCYPELLQPISDRRRRGENLQAETQPRGDRAIKADTRRYRRKRFIEAKTSASRGDQTTEPRESSAARGYIKTQLHSQLANKQRSWFGSKINNQSHSHGRGSKINCKHTSGLEDRNQLVQASNSKDEDPIRMSESMETPSKCARALNFDQEDKTEEAGQKMDDSDIQPWEEEMLASDMWISDSTDSAGAESVNGIDSLPGEEDWAMRIMRFELTGELGKEKDSTGNERTNTPVETDDMDTRKKPMEVNADDGEGMSVDEATEKLKEVTEKLAEMTESVKLASKESEAREQKWTVLKEKLDLLQMQWLEMREADSQLHAEQIAEWNKWEELCEKQRKERERREEMGWREWENLGEEERARIERDYQASLNYEKEMQQEREWAEYFERKSKYLLECERQKREARVGSEWMDFYNDSKPRGQTYGEGEKWRQCAQHHQAYYHTVAPRATRAGKTTRRPTINQPTHLHRGPSGHSSRKNY